MIGKTLTSLRRMIMMSDLDQVYFAVWEYGFDDGLFEWHQRHNLIEGDEDEDASN